MANKLIEDAKKWARDKFGIGVPGGGSVGNAISGVDNKIKNYFKPVAGSGALNEIRARDLIREITGLGNDQPGTISRVVGPEAVQNLITRPMARGVASIGLSTGIVPSKYENYTPTSDFGKKIYGTNQKLTGLRNYAKQETGFDLGKASLPAGILLAGMDAVPLNPLKGAGKKAVQEAPELVGDLLKVAKGKGEGVVDAVTGVKKYVKPRQAVDIVKTPKPKVIDIVGDGRSQKLDKAISQVVDNTIPVTSKRSYTKNVPIGGKVAETAENAKVASSLPDAPLKSGIVDDVIGDTVDEKTMLQRALDFAKNKARGGRFINFGNNAPVRVIEENFGPYADFVKQYFTKATTAAEDLNKTWRDIEMKEVADTLGNLGIKAGKAEDKLLFHRANGTLSLEKLKEIAPDRWKNIEEGTQFVRAKYDSYLKQINDVLTKYGYDAIPAREDYITHINELSLVQEALGNLTGTSKKELPVVMQQAMDYAKQGKEFFAFGKPRGRKSPFTDSAYAALNAYIPGAGRQIYHTPAIQELRSFEKVMNEQLASESLNVQKWIKEYIDTNLVGKMGKFDKATADLVGEKLPKILDQARARLSANQVGGNLAAALTNAIPVTQALATTSKTAVLKGMQALNPLEDITKIDGLKSSFLNRRFRGETRLVESLWQKAINYGSLPFKLIDKMTSKSVVAGKYFEGLEKGMSKTKAMQYADDYAAKLITDRSWGQMPNIYKEKVLGLATQYQAEVNNQLYFLMRDMPKIAGSKSELAWMTGQVLLYSFLYNELYEKATGRRPALDPIGTGLKINDIVQSNRSDAQKVGDITSAVADPLPYAGSLTGGGRIPLSAAMPKGSDFYSDGELDLPGGTMKSLKTAGLYLGMPTAGGQVKKTQEGSKAYKQGYSEAPAGGVRFDVEQNPQNLIRSLLFGQYATTEGQKYLKEGQTPLGSNQSAFIKGSNNKKETVNILRQNQKNQNLIDKANKAILAGKDPSKFFAKMSDDKGTKSITEQIIPVASGFAVMNKDGKITVKDTEEEANIELGKAKFDKTGKTKGEVGDYVYFKDKKGNITYKTKDKYRYELSGKQWTLDSDKYKTEKNYAAWDKAAEGRYNELVKYLNTLDPEADDLEIFTVQKQIQDLLQDAAKYRSYGGRFTKGSGGGSGGSTKQKGKVTGEYGGLITLPKTGGVQFELKKPRLYGTK